MRARVRQVGTLLALFVGVQLLAVAVAPGLAGSGVSYGDGGAALLPLVVGLALGTLLAVAVARYGVSPRLFRWLVLVGFAVSVWFVVGPVVARLFDTAGPGSPLAAVVGGVAAVATTVVVARTDCITLRNVLAAVATAGVAAVFGASLAPRFAVLGAALAAAYDAVAVYATGHMAAVAGLGRRLRLPTVFVVGREESADADDGGRSSNGVSESRSRDADRTRRTERGRNSDRTRSRDADATDEPDDAGRVGGLLLGTGDALFPAMIAASVRTHTAVVQVVGGPSPAAAVVGPVVGSVVGFLALQVVVRRGGTHAGLPFVVGGATLGWLVGGP